MNKMKLIELIHNLPDNTEFAVTSKGKEDEYGYTECLVINSDYEVGKLNYIKKS